MKGQKYLSVVLAGAVILGTVGCAGGGSSNEKNEKKNDSVNLTIWSPTDTEEIEQWWVEKLEEWNSSNPDIQVSGEAIDRSDSYAYENKITTATTSNDLPDILFVDGPNVSYYAANNIIIPLDDYFSEEELGDFMESTVSQGTYDGSIYALGATESSVALFYNKDYLDKAGIPYPTDSNIEEAWTWTQFYENAKKLTTDEYVGTNIIMDKGEGLSYALGSFLIENQTSFVNEDGTEAEGYINGEKSVETVEYLAKFIEEGYANIDPIKDEFLNGYAATMLGGSWNIVDLEKSNINWGISYFPIADDGTAASPTGDWAAAITKDCENVEAAGKFMQWLMSTENVATYAEAIAKPASRNSAYETMEGWDEGARALILWQLQNTGVSRPNTPVYSVLSNDFASALLNIFSGSDPQEELDVVADNFTENYNTYYAE